MADAKLAASAARQLYDGLLKIGAKASTLYKLELIIKDCDKGDEYIEEHKDEIVKMMMEIRSEDPTRQKTFRN